MMLLVEEAFIIFVFFGAEVNFREASLVIVTLGMTKIKQYKYKKRMARKKPSHKSC